MPFVCGVLAAGAGGVGSLPVCMGDLIAISAGRDRRSRGVGVGLVSRDASGAAAECTVSRVAGSLPFPRIISREGHEFTCAASSSGLAASSR